MAGFRKDKTTAAQTAANVAGQVTAARIASGESLGSVENTLVGTYQALFDAMAPVVDADNALFAEVEASAPATKSKDKSEPAPPASGDPGDTIFGGGKFKGMTIAAVHALSEEEAKAKGHNYGTGSTYVVNYVATDKNSNETTKVAAQTFLAALANKAA